MTVMGMLSLNFHPKLIILTELFEEVNVDMHAFQSMICTKKVVKFDCFNYNMTSSLCELPDLIRIQITEVRMMENTSLFYKSLYG